MIDILCLGDPSVMGDAVGPMVGTKLSNKSLGADIQIIGTISKPVTKTTYESSIAKLRPGATVVVVDSAIGKPFGHSVSIGTTEPGSSVDSGIAPIGDVSIKCYIADTPEGLLHVPLAEVEVLAQSVTTGLLYLINNKDIIEYIDI